MKHRPPMEFSFESAFEAVLRAKRKKDAAKLAREASKTGAGKEACANDAGVRTGIGGQSNSGQLVRRYGGQKGG